MDNKLEPKSVFIAACGTYYVFGNEDNRTFNNDISVYLHNDDNHELGYFDLHADTERWANNIFPLISDLTEKVERISFRFNEDIFYELNKENIIPACEYSIEQMNKKHIEYYIENIDPSYKKIFASVDEFIQHGIGYCTMIQNIPVSYCTSVFKSKEYAEMSVITSQNYRKQGLGYFTCVEFIKYCLSNYIKPNWSCNSENTESVRLALKLGFEKERDYILLASK